MKKTLLLLSLLMSFNVSFASLSPHLTSNPPILSYEPVGMNDSNEQSLLRSQRDGAALQYVFYANNLEIAGVDQHALTKDINSLVANTASYYKKHPEFKGIHIVTLILFPGYQSPYQIPTDHTTPENRDLITDFNQKIKDNSQCNSEGFCSLNAVINSTFINPDDYSQQLNEKEFNQFISQQPSNNSTTYTKNPHYLKPIKYLLILGVNGYLVSEVEAKILLNQENQP